MSVPLVLTTAQRRLWGSIVPALRARTSSTPDLKCPARSTTNAIASPDLHGQVSLSMTQIVSKRSLTLALPPSCIAFCPTRPDLFVVGTYYLHPDRSETSPQAGNVVASHDDNRPAGDIADLTATGAAQKRTGSLILFRLGPDDIVIELQTLPTEYAILDLEWCPTRHGAQVNVNLLAVASSTGEITFFDLVDTSSTDNESCLRQRSLFRITEPAVLVLFLTWHPTNPHVIGVTLSNGDVGLCICNPADESSSRWTSGSTVRFVSIGKHDLEAWILAFSEDGSHIVSGGDDMALTCVTINIEESGNGTELTATPLWSDRGRSHNAGVTVILPLGPDLLVTGSYDDHIRLLSGINQTGRRRELASLDLGGGVWRVRVLPTARSSRQQSDDAPAGPGSTKHTAHAAGSPNGICVQQSFILLASCMHVGTRIVRLAQTSPRDRTTSTDALAGGDVGEAGWSFEVLARFEEHQSMNYGSDVQPLWQSLSPTKTLVSTSFYDKLLCVWEVDSREWV